jgi:hypothetical protein
MLRTIKSLHGDIRYQANTGTFTEAIEQAVNDNINLTFCDFAYENLSNATLDSADLTGSIFRGANLTGANLSETNLTGCDFSDADLYAACLAFSELDKTNFIYANFGGTLIDEAIMNACKFAGLSCLDLDFATAKRIRNCTYIEPDQKMKRFSSPPIVIKGLGKPTIFFRTNTLNPALIPLFLSLDTHQLENNSILVE